MRKQIGEQIRELRKQQNITQEKLAEYLGVSAQAISKWENGLAYPDVTLIPMLARVFSVTTDVLFDMENEDLLAQQKEFEEIYQIYCQKGMLEKRLTIMKDALKAFPQNHCFMMNLAETMDAYTNGSATQQLLYKEQGYVLEIQSLCQRVLKDSAVDMERHRALRLLCSCYADSRNLEKAKQLAETTSDMEFSREFLLENVLEGENKLKQAQHNMLQCIDYVATTLINIAFGKEYGLSERLSIEEKIEYIKTANQLYSTIITDGNYQFYHRIIGWNYRRLAELYLLLDKKDKAFEYLQLNEKEAIAYDNLTNYYYTAPFVNMLEYQPEEYTKLWVGSEQGMLLYRLKELKKYFEGHQEFVELYKRLEEATKDEASVDLD